MDQKNGNKNILKSELRKMVSSGKTFGENISDIGDSLLLIGCINEENNNGTKDRTHAEIIMCGESANISQAIFAAMMKETGIANIILTSLHLYVDRAIEKMDRYILAKVIAALKGNADPDFQKFKEQGKNKNWN
ncbi:hypothetical protein GGR21_003354 [Dysgonomonas hofstadii]|uniref:Uncharacterized protein n=1 Tax=Dysgonomonas hofstadii TaxID=637886 RepID=A0A840CMY4_9BACT|nr:hypothetical protein [Dysgonomonas hofstadii]MBB4037437.1 hypothetical protein [Dysgonomonas hofstadii]